MPPQLIRRQFLLQVLLRPWWRSNTKGPASDASDKTSQLLMVSIVHTAQSSSVSRTNLTANCPAWRTYFHNWTRVHGSEPYIFSQFPCFFGCFGKSRLPCDITIWNAATQVGLSESVPGRLLSAHDRTPHFGTTQVGKYPLVICYIAIENGHRNSEFSH